MQSWRGVNRYRPDQKDADDPPSRRRDAGRNRSSFAAICRRGLVKWEQPKIARHAAQPLRSIASCKAKRKSSNTSEAYLGVGDTAGAKINLSAGGDLTEAAANLFAYLNKLDDPQWSGIAVAPIPEEGLGRAINDRLRRAAAPRR